jgi:CheY-like chemotaxis protein
MHPPNRRVLVIDDSVEIHNDFRKILQPETEETDPFETRVFGAEDGSSIEAPFEVEFASQGQQGLEMVRQAVAGQRPYAMAFVDVRMPPGWDGIETISKLWPVDPELQVVVCTAYSDYSWEEMTAKLGRSDQMVILKKPFDQIEALQLASAMTEKWRLNRQSKIMVRDLEQNVVALRWRTAFFEALVNSAIDGILVLNEHGQKVVQNEHLDRLLKLPPEIGAKVADVEPLRYISESAKNTEQFRQKVLHLNAHRNETSRDEIEFRDGSIMDSYSSPVLDPNGTYYGRIWAFRDITAEKRMRLELEKTHEELLLASRRAGMAEVAAGVLDNVGHVINSINVATASVTESIRKCNAVTSRKVVASLREHEADLANYLSTDSKGRHITEYLTKLLAFLADEQTKTLNELNGLQQSVEHIKSIVTKAL